MNIKFFKKLASKLTKNFIFKTHKLLGNWFPKSAGQLLKNNKWFSDIKSFVRAQLKLE